MNHPIIGDVGHGDRHHNHLFHSQLEQHRLYLAATELSFTHPFTCETITIEAPLEQSFIKCLEFLNIPHTHPTFHDFNFIDAL